MKMKEDEKTTSNEVKQEEGKKTKKRAKTTKFRKAPQAPKRFKSAFIFFSVEKHPEIRQRLEANEDSDVPNVAKLVSEEWRNLSPEDRAVWEKKAADDKRRYELERTMYTGPWKIPASKRAKKDPDAPKRPMSAFLAFSKKMRSQVKQENLHLSNTEISKLLATKWKEASDEERNIHIKREAEERGAYKIAISKWRLNQEEKLEAQRKQREQIAQMAMANGVGAPGRGMPPNGQVGYPHGGYGYRAPSADMGGPNMGAVPPPYSNMPYDASRYPYNHQPEENNGVGNEYYGMHESPHSAPHYNESRHRSQPPYTSNESQAPFISNAPPESQGYYNNNDGYAGNHQHPGHAHSNDTPTYAAKDQRMMPEQPAQPPNGASWGHSNSNDRFISQEQPHPRAPYGASGEQQYYNNTDKYPQQRQAPNMPQNADNYPPHENYHNDRYDGQYYNQEYYEYS